VQKQHSERTRSRVGPGLLLRGEGLAGRRLADSSIVPLLEG
jgi:hypothetical protein